MRITLEDLEEMAPGETERRRAKLEVLRSELGQRGIVTQPLTESDLECFWVTTEDGRAITPDLVDDYRDEWHTLRKLFGK